MKTIGRNVIAELYGCSAELLDDLEALRQHLKATAISIGATIVGETFHRFAPQGVSGTLVIAESHLSLHTWPEKGYVAIDIYTCGELEPRPGIEYLAHRLQAQSYRVQEILRGLPEDFESARPITPADVSLVMRQATEHSIPAEA